jgi:hypothetical protein
MNCLDCISLVDRAKNPLGRGKCLNGKTDAWGCDKACKLFTAAPKSEKVECQE